MNQTDLNERTAGMVRVFIEDNSNCNLHVDNRAGYIVSIQT